MIVSEVSDLDTVSKINNIDGFVKSPSAVLRFTGKGLNVRKVRLALSRLARLAYELFTKPLAMFIHGPWPHRYRNEKIRTFYGINNIGLQIITIRKKSQNYEIMKGENEWVNHTSC